MKSEFISLVSHELRTPLTIIKEGLNLITDEIPGKINEKQKQLLDAASQNADRLAKIINDLLDISKIESGKFVCHKTAIDISEIAVNVSNLFKDRLTEIGVEFNLTCPQKPLLVYADEARPMLF